MISATELRPGMIVIYGGELHRVHSVLHKTPGNLRGFVQAKLRSLRSGAMNEHRFRSEDRIEKASLDTHEMQYLYSDATGHHFMNQETYDQITLPDEVVGEAMKYLLSETVITVDFHDGTPVSVELPTTVSLKITETEPGMKGATASASYKPAKLETGLVVQVPQFVEAGTVVKIDTRDDSYLERVSGPA
ncbi:MAG: elongation factor P [Acidithiobacillales bacterium]